MVDVRNPSSLAIDTDDLVALQLRLNFHQRKIFAPQFAARVNQMAAALGVAPSDLAGGSDLAAALRDVGYARLGPILPENAVKEVIAHFSERPCFNAHVVAQSDGRESRLEDLASRAHFGSYRPTDVITAPHILELANDPRILDAVGDYLGCVPSLYSMNAWWSFPRPEVGEVITQKFHRDEDDFGNCVLFLYLTDTDEDGCHQYIRYSHRLDELRRRVAVQGRVSIDLPGGRKFDVTPGLEELFEGNGHDRDDVYTTLLGDLIESIEGAAGDGFLTDPDGLHRAKHPIGKRRLIVWLRYGMHRNCSYVRDLLWPVPKEAVAGRLPDTAAARFVNRLVVVPD